MTSPFPTSFPGMGQVIQDPGTGAALASGIAQVLAQQQLQRENEFRQQQLAAQIAQQQALAQYYQGTIGVQQQEQERLRAKDAAAQQAAAQIGRAQQATLGVGQPMGAGGMLPSSSTQPPAGQGIAPSMGAGQPGVFQDVLQGGAQTLAPAYGQIFQGVSPENMPAAVEAVGKAKELTAQPEGPELPTAAKEFEFMRHLSQVDPSGQAAKFFYDNWVKKQPGVVVNVGDKGETAFSVETAKLAAQRAGEVKKGAFDAAGSMPSMMEAYKLVPRAATGFGANQLVALARIAGQAGYKPGKDLAADTQTMVKLLRDQTLAYLQTRALGSGTAVSDKDREFMERQSAADPTMEPTAIKRIIRINMGLALERMISAKMELQQNLQTYPETATRTQSDINLIDKKLQPIWNEYWKMLSKEQKEEAEARVDVTGTADMLLPAR